eukprot:c18661_g1_i1 orf=138-302(-)
MACSYWYPFLALVKRTGNVHHIKCSYTSEGRRENLIRSKSDSAYSLSWEASLAS